MTSDAIGSSLFVSSSYRDHSLNENYQKPCFLYYGKLVSFQILNLIADLSVIIIKSCVARQVMNMNLWINYQLIYTTIFTGHHCLPFKCP